MRLVLRLRRRLRLMPRRELRLKLMFESRADG